METITLSKKITTNALGLDSKTLADAAKAAKGKAVDVCNILAMVHGYSAKASKFDAQKEDIRFKGQFEATNLLTGEVIRAADAYFPGAAADWLKAAFDECRKQKEGSLPAIAFTITAKLYKRQDGSESYTYGVKTLVERNLLADPFAELRKALPKSAR